MAQSNNKNSRSINKLKKRLLTNPNTKKNKNPQPQNKNHLKINY